MKAYSGCVLFTTQLIGEGSPGSTPCSLLLSSYCCDAASDDWTCGYRSARLCSVGSASIRPSFTDYDSTCVRCTTVVVACNRPRQSVCVCVCRASSLSDLFRFLGTTISTCRVGRQSRRQSTRFYLSVSLVLWF